MTDKKEGRQRSLDEVKESITKLLQNKKSRKAKAALLTKLKTGGKVETFLPKAPAAAKVPKIGGKAAKSNLLKVNPTKGKVIKTPAEGKISVKPGAKPATLKVAPKAAPKTAPKTTK